MKRKRFLSPSLAVLISFFIVIMLGSLLLCCPFSQSSGTWGNYVDCLLTSTSATCVTGLCSFSGGIGKDLTFAGQLIVLIMIQIGGLGFITFLAFLLSFIRRKIEYKDRYYLSQAVNSDNIPDVSSFVRKVIGISFVIELLGFCLGIPAFLSIPGTNVGEAMWRSIFISISSFNNAGFDIFGSTSLVRNMGNIIVDSMPTWAYYYMCSYIMILIILGGISFPVIIEVFSFKKRPKQYKAFTKTVLLMSTILLLAGFGLFILSDCFQGKNFTPFEALFQSVTCRTAGFAIFDQNSLSDAGKSISSVLMFIGGSPLSTAGGIKTVTIFIIILAIIKFFAGKKVTAWNRKYTQNTIVKSMAVTFIGIIVVAIGFLIISVLEKNNSTIPDAVKYQNIGFEVFSAFGTVGLSASLTPLLTVGSKITLCFIMFIGRLGPMTLFQVFQQNMNKEHDDHFDYVEENVLIG